MTESSKDSLAICILIVVALLVLSAVIASGVLPFLVVLAGIVLAIAGVTWAVDRVSDF